MENRCRPFRLASAILLMASVPFLSTAAWKPGLQGGFCVNNVWSIVPEAVETLATNIYADPFIATNVWDGVATNEPWTDPTLGDTKRRQWIFRGQIRLEGPTWFSKLYKNCSACLYVNNERLTTERWEQHWLFESILVDLPPGWYDFKVAFYGGSKAVQTTSLCKQGFPCAFGISTAREKPKSMADCTYPADSGEMSRFRYDDGTAFTDSAHVRTEPDFLAGHGGQMVPQVGVTSGFSRGQRINCSAPATLCHEDVHYRCVGAVVETETEEGWGHATTNLGVTAFVHTYGDAQVRITWLYEVDGCRLSVVPFAAESGDRFSLSPEPDLDYGCYSSGTDVTATALPAEGNLFARWYGDLDGADGTESIVLKMDRPRHVYYGSGWLYDPKGKTMTDGNWVLNMIQSGTDLQTKGVKAVSLETFLDLQVAVRDPWGTNYTVKVIGPSSFQKKSIVRLYLPLDLESILGGQWAGPFFECKALETVTPFLPASVTNIGEMAFYGCTRLRGELQVENPACDTISQWAFQGCVSLGSAVLPSVTTFQNVAFYSCSSLSNVVFSAEEVALGDKVFLKEGYTTGRVPVRYYFPGKAPRADRMGVQAIDNYQMPARLYGSRRLDPAGWAAFAEPLTEADLAKADYPGEGTFGVFVKDKMRHWCVDYRSPRVPKGTVLMLR